MRKLRNGKLPKLTKAATLRPRIQTLAVGFPRLDSSYYSVLPEFKLGEKKKKTTNTWEAQFWRLKSQSSKHSGIWYEINESVLEVVIIYIYMVFYS